MNWKSKTALNDQKRASAPIKMSHKHLKTCAIESLFHQNSFEMINFFSLVAEFMNETGPSLINFFRPAPFLKPTQTGRLKNGNKLPTPAAVLRWPPRGDALHSLSSCFPSLCFVRTAQAEKPDLARIHYTFRTTVNKFLTSADGE